MTIAPEPERAGLAFLAQLEQAGALRITGLYLAKPDLTYNQAEALALMLGKLHEAVRFAIGDFIILVEKLFGEAAYQLLEQLGLSETARREYVRVAEQVPRSVRHKGLSWSHHRAIAPLPAPEQRKWLAHAYEKRLSHHALRDELRNGAEPEPVNVCRCCHRPLDA